MSKDAAGSSTRLSGSTGLISIDTSGPTSADVPPDARLADAPHLQALHEPAPRLDLAPRHILQQPARRSWATRLREDAGLAVAAVLLHAGFAAAFFSLLSFRDVDVPRTLEIPVEVVAEAPKPEVAKGNVGTGGQAASATRADAQQAAGPTGDPAKPITPAGIQQAMADPATAPAAPASPVPSKPPVAPPSATAPHGSAKPGQSSAPPAPPSQGSKFVAPPPDAARAATQDRENKAANLAPDEHQRDEATHEAKPATVPQALTTPDQKAAFAVPAPVAPKADAVERSAPPIPAKTPSATDKLAAALPMDTSAMPSSFRAVLSGNGSQLKAVYGGIVQGRLAQAQPAIVDAAYSQRLKGNVSVVFTIDDAGHLSSLSIVQSSGDPKLDALALHWIQTAAPFPPPPPEAEHTYRKALLFGN